MARALIRPLAGADEVAAGLRVFFRAMVGLPVSTVDPVEATEAGRFLGAFDGGEIVGGADAYTSGLVVPGGALVPHAAVTHVGVLPTHRRRGLAGRLLIEQLRDAAARGEMVASLRASEATIYGRYGYGIASESRSARVSLARATLRPEVPAGGTVRLVDGAVTTELLRGVYDRSRGVGVITRPDGWWRRHELARASATAPWYAVVHSTGGVDDGYALYRPEDTTGWFTSAERVVTVTDLVSLSGGARAGLWRHLLALDLVDVVVFDSLALDDPLPLATLDRRAVELGAAHDETWLRLVNVEAALRARSYGTAKPVVIGVRDPILPANEGAYVVGPDGAARTDAAPQLTVDVGTLAATYLGGTRWRALASVGRVDARDPAAVARADLLFATAALPFSGTVF
ncbi:GNAT family N-acetyltransferase [Tsukamurella soli]|uniref:GNAT family N-acetyltransferase n=1 Tax=Tsukamurella soli TaxID=644556 RepID=A0ABP8JUV6_9ACTN